MTTNVVVLPTKWNVDAAWAEYQAVCEEVRRDPSLNLNEDFRARLAKAECDWLDIFEIWNNLQCPTRCA